MSVTAEVEEAIRHYLAADPTSPTGLRWVVTPRGGPVAGDPAFTAVRDNGYHVGSVKYKLLRAHRVVWFLHHGTWPQQVDHLNGDRRDNRIENLRAATALENQHNRIRRGCTRRASGKWDARIMVNYKTLRLGLFNTEAEARAAYLEAKRTHHPSAPERCYQQEN